MAVLLPQDCSWFGLFPFRSPLLGKSIFLSSPPVTMMFQFSGFAPLYLFYSVQGCGIYLSRRVSPFGYLRVNVCLRLTEAFRSLPRPSSPLSAQASTMCSFLSSPFAWRSFSGHFPASRLRRLPRPSFFTFDYAVFKEQGFSVTLYRVPEN